MDIHKPKAAHSIREFLIGDCQVKRTARVFDVLTVRNGPQEEAPRSVPVV